MKKIKIDENITTRGLNDLYYCIDIYDDDGHICNNYYFYSVLYERKIAKILHETSVFKFFENMEGKIWTDEQCLEYIKKIEQVIKLIEKIEEV